MARSKRYQKTTGKWFEYMMARSVFFALALFPFRLRARVIYAIARILGGLSGAIDKRIRTNIRRSFPEMDSERVDRLVRKNVRVLANMANEFCQEPRMTQSFRDRWIVTLPDRATHKRYLDGGGILVLGHLGSWETMGVSIMNVTDTQLWVFAKRQSNPWANDWIERNRATQRIKLVYTDESPRVALRLLGKKETVAFISDQDAGSTGEFYPFLGRLASTFQGPALFARMTDVPIYFCLSYYDETNRLVFELEEFERPDWNAKDDVQEWEREFTYRWVKLLERRVHEHPGDYYWLHRRWHTRPEDPEAVWKFWHDWERARGFEASARHDGSI